MNPSDIIKFIRSSSASILKQTAVAHMAEAQNTRKEIMDLLEIWHSSAVDGELLMWFAEHGEELRAPENIFTLPKRRRPSPRWRRLIK